MTFEITNDDQDDLLNQIFGNSDTLDEHIPDKINDDISFWKPGYHWWSGWWKNKGQSLRHELIEYIFKYNCLEKWQQRHHTPYIFTYKRCEI